MKMCSCVENITLNLSRPQFSKIYLVMLIRNGETLKENIFNSKIIKITPEVLPFDIKSK